MSTVYRRTPLIEASPMQSESLLFDPATNRFCLLNGTATFVWERLLQPATVEQLAAAVCRHFDGPEPARVERDVREALQRLTDLALVAPEPVARSRFPVSRFPFLVFPTTQELRRGPQDPIQQPGERACPAALRGTQSHGDGPEGSAQGLPDHECWRVVVGLSITRCRLIAVR